MNTRPDPDQLLARIQQEQAQAARGKLKIFFGACAGVGKTYAMLLAARNQLEQGKKVLIGVIETHGRKDTETLVAGLHHLPKHHLPYRGRLLEEFDIDAALAWQPTLVLVDELAHSNVPGSRHPKRWQDVQELLEAGIDVYTTINVQHLETLNDVVSGITGIRVWETVPDHVFNQADEVVLVDLPPDELLQRLHEGKVYLPQQAEQAITNFFRKGNLLALRELALRRTADRVDASLLAYRRQSAVEAVWQTRDALLVCVGPGTLAERLIRTAARLAGRLEATMHVLHIEIPDRRYDRQNMLRSLELAASLGAQTATVTANDPISAIVTFARSHNLSWVLVGRDRIRSWQPWHRSFAERIGNAAPELAVVQVVQSDNAVIDPAITTNVSSSTWYDYLQAGLICVLSLALLIPLADSIALTNIAMLFLLTVLLVAVNLGPGPAVMAAFLVVATFDFFFVIPRFSFAVSDAQYLITFGVMLTVALISGQLTARYKQQAQLATKREAQSQALYQMARNLSAALMPTQIAQACEQFMAGQFSAGVRVLIADLQNELNAVPMPNAINIDEGVARWAFDHGEAAGLFTTTLPSSPLLYLPLKAPMRTRGVLAIAPREAWRIQGPEARCQLDTFAHLVAIAVERMHYVEVAQNTLVQMESESMRNSLLTAISHDLRTPLSVLVSLAESLRFAQPSPAQITIIDTIYRESLRMSMQVNNLLDMARLQAGKIQLNRQWQPLEEIVGAALRSLDAILVDYPVQVALPVDLPMVEVDAVLMERVFVNLLENIAKYTPAGTAVVIGAAMQIQEIMVWVEDNGPGLPLGREKSLFQKFERGDHESVITGSGLGLAISRTIVELHGGSIHAEQSSGGGGARLVFALPRGTPPEVMPEYEANT